MTYDHKGERFGRLLVIERSGSRNGQILWRCVCDCGKEKIALSYLLRKGDTRSCGCLQKDRASESRTTHGKGRSRAYTIWHNMLKRCHNPNNPAFGAYGGRGIRVAYATFEQFFADLGDPPDGMSIERIDNSKGYEPGNCRWATPAEQARNKRNNIWLSYRGETLCLNDWAKRFGVDRSVLRHRVKKGWPVERVLTQPHRVREGGRHRLIPLV